MSIYSKYIGYIKNSNGDFGTVLFIDKNKAVTATHVVEDDTDRSLFYNNEAVIDIIDPDCIEKMDNYAILRFQNDICDCFDPSELRFNTRLSEIYDYDLSWEAIGFLMDGRNCREDHILGKKCLRFGRNNKYILVDILMNVVSCEGMSGGPVIINGMVVGILQEERKDSSNTVKELSFSNAKEFEAEINESAVVKRVFNNKEFEPIDYSENFTCDDYITRDVLVRETNEEYKLKTLLTGEQVGQRLFVLLGEAGLGKTIELQATAKILRNSNYNPLHKSLRDIVNNQSVEDYFPELKEYVENQVPFCLILDGYEEIKNIDYRDSVFPSLLNQFVNKLDRIYKNGKYSILISSRKSYYFDGKFSRFIELELCELSMDDVKNMLDNREVEKEAFFNEVEKKNLMSFVRNPFYLCHIIDLFNFKNVLPDSHDLMDEIINHLFKEKNYEKFRGQLSELTRENRRARFTLRKLSVVFLMSATTSMTTDQLEEINGYIFADGKKELIKCSGIFEVDEDEKWEFKHNIFCEYLAAEFLNEKYNDDFEGLLKVIAYEYGIYSNYKNVVTFLLLIRKSTDLNEWIFTHCPAEIMNYELSKIGEKRSAELFESIFLSAIKKGYFIQRDSEVNISSLINYSESISFLLKVINTSNNEIELYNAIRLLGTAENLCGKDEIVLTSLLDFLSSDRGNHHHKRDAIYAVLDLNLSNKTVTDFLYEKFRSTSDKELLRGINRYVLKNDLADLFIDTLINQLVNDDNTNYLSYLHYDCLEKIKTKESFMKLFSTILSMGDVSIKMHRTNQLKKTVDKLKNSIKSAITQDDSGELFRQVLRLSALFVKKYIWKNNSFATIINELNKDFVAITYYYDMFNKEPVLFRMVASDLNCFVDFLIKNYCDGNFANRDNMMFDYCVREMEKDNPEREKCISVIEEMGFENSEISLNYIKYNENNKVIDVQNYIFGVNAIFDSSVVFDEISELVSSSGLVDPTFGDFRLYVYKNFNYHSKEYFVNEFLGGMLAFDEKISVGVKFFSENEREWLISSSKQFVDLCSDYNSYLSHVQKDRIIKEVTDYLNEIDSNRTDYLTHDAVYLARKLIDYVSEDLLIKLLQFPTALFYGCEKESGFPNFLVDRLTPEIVQERILFFIDNDMIFDGLDEACLKYSLSTDFCTDSIIGLALRVISNEFSDSIHYDAWKYLIENGKQDLIIRSILREDIDKYNLICEIHMLEKTNDSDLADYISDFFNQLYELYNSNISEDIAKDILGRNPFLKRVYQPVENVKQLKDALLYCLRRLMGFLILNDVDGYTDMYLDNMISTHSLSSFDSDTFQLAISEVDNPKYLRKILTILECICDGSFDMKGKVSTIYSDVCTSIRSIAKNDADQTIEILSEYLECVNQDMRREVNLIYEGIIKNKYEKQVKKYSVEEIRNIVFSE
jgi:hypothetical protein